MNNTSTRYFGTGRRRGYEESLISDDDERSGADEAGHGMRLPSAPSSSSSSSSVPPQGYGSAASDFSEYSAFEGESELLSDREITRKLRVGGGRHSSNRDDDNRIDVKIWAARSLAVILAVSMIFVVSMQQSKLSSSESITNGVNSESEPIVSDLMASNLPPNVRLLSFSYHL